ncbi:MAG: hypothetical protein R3E02_04685 [Blastomonas sp.]
MTIRAVRSVASGRHDRVKGRAMMRMFRRTGPALSHKVDCGLS